MSRVFPYTAIAKGALPTKDDFEATLQMMRKRFASPAFEAVLYFGSVLRHDSVATSDIDCIVVYDWKRNSNAFSVMAELTESAWEHHVPLQLIPFDSEMAALGYHTIGEDFGHHLRWAATRGGVLKGDPLSHFSFHSSVENVRGYVASKLTSIQKAYIRHSTMGQGERLQFLAKVFDVPSYLARKVLWMKGHHLEVDSKEQVGKRYLECFPELAPLFQRVIGVKRDYERRVCSREKITEDAYRSWLVGIRERTVPQVLEFLRGNALVLGPA